MRHERRLRADGGSVGDERQRAPHGAYLLPGRPHEARLRAGVQQGATTHPDARSPHHDAGERRIRPSRASLQEPGGEEQPPGLAEPLDAGQEHERDRGSAVVRVDAGHGGPAGEDVEQDDRHRHQQVLRRKRAEHAARDDQVLQVPQDVRLAHGVGDRPGMAGQVGGYGRRRVAVGVVEAHIGRGMASAARPQHHAAHGEARRGEGGGRGAGPPAHPERGIDGERQNGQAGRLTAEERQHDGHVEQRLAPALYGPERHQQQRRNESVRVEAVQAHPVQGGIEEVPQGEQQREPGAAQARPGEAVDGCGAGSQAQRLDEQEDLRAVPEPVERGEEVEDEAEVVTEGVEPARRHKW